MEYAGSYALYNYRLAPGTTPGLPFDYSSLRLIRAFEHGLDPTSSEAGFVLVHVAMVQHSGPLVSGCVGALSSLADLKSSPNQRAAFNDSLAQVVTAMQKVNAVMNTMWARSKPGSYTSFRTFIFGITSQTMFPRGVLYTGVAPERLSFRGESGANDSMVPLMDNLLQLSMPATPLTDILKDFRSYRPGNHREFLEWVAQTAAALDLKGFAAADRQSAKVYMQALDQVREFRWRHWCFTREYILKQSKYSRATGGSPIVTWLPNQLMAVLDGMVEAGQWCGAELVGSHGPGLEEVHANESGEEKKGDAQVQWKDGASRDAQVEEMLEMAASQKLSLEREVKKYCAERGPDSST